MTRRIALALLLLGAPTAAGGQQRASFDHEKHRKVFPACAACHLGAAQAGAALLPAATVCASCHDGTVQPRVAWRPRDTWPATNLRFDHATHRAAIARLAAGAASACVACHAEPDAPWMVVTPVKAERCFDCHGIDAEHLAAPDAECARCHLPLAEARNLTPRDVAGFPRPPSHLDPAFASGAVHGARAAAKTPGGVLRSAQSCATCHAREFCVSCHVDAPEQPVIQAFEPDPRSVAIQARLRRPASHADPAFLVRHGAAAGASCRSCHARESCLSCHATPPAGSEALAVAAPGRGTGAVIRRHAPASHVDGFAEAHGAQAVANPTQCGACHIRPDCQACHRPAAGAGPGYHGDGFLARHPAAAYARHTACTDCHNAGSFCSTCHQRAGLVAPGPLRSGYHDAREFFIVGHGQAARQSLESCVTCHAERDCQSCHSALGGRRFDPHGPGFDAGRLRRKNPEMCTACHGAAIPG